MTELADVQWLKIRSWHIYKTFTRVPDGAITLCNRRASASTYTDVRPENEKTCEVCLRMYAK